MDDNNKTYYEILGVDKNASNDSIEEARDRIKSENPYSSSLYNQIDKAYDTLTNPELRKKYDESLNNNIGGIDADIKIYVPKIELENLNNNLRKSKEKYAQSLEEIKQFYNKESFDEKDKEWNKLLENTLYYYSQIITISKQLGVKVDVIKCTDFFKKIRMEKENKEAQSLVNVNTNLNDKEKQFELLTGKYQKAISKIILINKNNLNSEEKDYSEWKPSLQTAYRAYDELIDFCKKNGINKILKTVDELLDELNISKEIPNTQNQIEKTIVGEKETNKVPHTWISTHSIYDELVDYGTNINFKMPQTILTNETQSKPIDLTKNKNSEPNTLVDPSIYEDFKYIQKNKLTDSNYETLKEIDEFNKKVSKIKFTAIGAGLGFMLLISPIGGFGPIISTLGALGVGKLFNSWINKRQSKRKFALTKESYTGKITEINTIESQIIRSSNELLKKEIEDLAKNPNDNYRLELAKLKYLNELDILDQIIDVRKNSKSKKGGFTSDSLKLAALKQEYKNASKNYNIIKKKIERKELENNEYAQNLNLNSIRYKNLTIGNALLKRDIKKFKMQEEALNRRIENNEEESTKTR